MAPAPADDAASGPWRLEPVTVEAVELHRVELPLVTPFRSAHGAETVRDVLLVRLVAGGVEGWGECVAPSRPSYTSEYVDGAHAVLRDLLVPTLRAAGPVEPVDLPRVFGGVVGHPMAKTALETALLDARLRATDRSLADFLGATRARVEAGVALGMASSEAELLDWVDGYVAEGYRRVKLKIAPGHDVGPVRAVRQRHPDLPLQVDANGSYTLDDLEVLQALDRFGLLLIEQPLPPDDLLGHAQLAHGLRTPICLDETITSARVAAQAVSLGACSVINVKPGRVGGLLEAIRIHELCRARGVPLWVGGMLESGVGRAANVALAALPGFTLPGDLSASERYFTRDVITEPFVLTGGHLTVPTTPGIGVTVDRQILRPAS